MHVVAAPQLHPKRCCHTFHTLHTLRTCAFAIFSGFLASRYSVQVRAEPVVSWPATSMLSRSSRSCVELTCGT